MNREKSGDRKYRGGILRRSLAGDPSLLHGAIWHALHHDEPEPTAAVRGQSVARRSRALADPRGRFMEALAELRRRDARLTKGAMATEMGIDPGTLNGYIRDGIVPPFPWEDVREDR